MSGTPRASLSRGAGRSTDRPAPTAASAPLIREWQCQIAQPPEKFFREKSSLAEAVYLHEAGARRRSATTASRRPASRRRSDEPTKSRNHQTGGPLNQARRRMTALTPVYETSGCEVATAIPQDRIGRPAPRPYRRIRKRSDRGVAQPPEYTLFRPSTCPINRDHLTDYIGAGGRLGWRPRFVFNAFRHHGLYRVPPPPATCCGCPSAQRLSASRIISAGSSVRSRSEICSRCSTPFGITDYIGRAKTIHRAWTLCAQRLSASRIISEDLAGRSAADRYPVLNAFRHHGLYRSVGDAHDPVDDRCSTPFGITDYIGSPLCRLTRRSRARGCSTPFGITDYIGSFAEGAIVDPDLCSTPFGITDYIGASADDRGHRTHMVLNAFRHHGLYRARTGP